ncbi:chemotaxis protein CheA [Altererythrobacter arenosus]|uniref:histidine kinase n=1 Tax=Altererythrobacter arenosus TaxID=3032592 RepID=A0ABY8FT45_9SPHN|nr:chemotaxis protein CheA [Altererythrobacter sp. CAU 1644]WFL78179.1 chemotaxis protein CheA [Altererythrobacter sp. CAU 1644]
MDDLLADFVAETKEMLEASEGELIAWEANPADRARLDAIFRFVHTVKGNCGFFDFPRLEKLSHAAEDALAEVRAGRRAPDAPLVTAVLAIIDRIGQMADAIEAGEEFPEGGDDSLIAALDAGETDLVEADVSAADPQDPAKPGDRKADAGNGAPRTIRLPVDLLDRVMSGVSDIVLARNDLAHRLRAAGTQPTIDGPFERLTSILNDVREAVTRMRMQRIELLFGAFPRLVRDLSAELGKQVLIDLEGGDVEIDREMVEMIRDPMIHIIRNAIDHGIEPPAERLKAGKREMGILGIAARQSGNKISIVISDDGRGLDEKKIAAKAVAVGLLSAEERERASRDEILQFIFEPGLSTAETVSAVSGRGVGLDVVRENLEKIGGSIRVSTNEGEGTYFYLQIPLTLSIISGLTVEVSGQRFAIPQSYVEEIVHFGSNGIEYSKVGGSILIDFRGRRTPCLSLAEVLGLEDRIDPTKRSMVLIRLASGDMIALAVDKIHGIADLVVKPLPPAVMATDLYGGSTLLDDGSPVLLLDIPLIAYNRGLVSDVRSLKNRQIEQSEEHEVAKGVRAMTFIGLNGRKQAIALALVHRIETVRPEAVDRSGEVDRVVVDEQILPLIGLPDEMPAGDKLRMLRLSDGACDLLYAVSEVDDAVLLEGDLVAVDDASFVQAVTLHESESIALIDGHKLFARHGVAPKKSASITCLLPDDPWARRILGPLLVNAGYTIAEASADKSDVVITIDRDFEDSSGEPAVPTIRLRSLPDSEVPENERAASIYRYDRDGLLKALSQFRKGVAA